MITSSSTHPRHPRNPRFIFAIAAFSIPVCPQAADVIFVAGPDTHAWGQHKHYAGSMLLADSLRAAIPKVTTEVVREFPSAEKGAVRRGISAWYWWILSGWKSFACNQEIALIRNNFPGSLDR
jgi:hypothetical protein